ncbi:protein FAR1-RELATED SEQUENCE 5-like [Trifolium pratense]|uniref:protein FAR1-RELATED SEQUENCE 5-like n=1 Tax=Trifolium pratense TaxID=57577 RepID=UPI001E69617B|nr:protein FAR1-RELATED SEQUENCE 5-like [Trifolium pratense]
MDDSNTHKVDTELGSMTEQGNVDAKPPDEPHNVVPLPLPHPPPPPPPTIDFRIQFTTATKFDNRAQMLKWVSDLARSLGFVTVIVKSDNEAIGRKGYVHIGCQRGGKYREYCHRKSEQKMTLKCGCPFKLKSYLLSSGQWSLNVVNDEHKHEMTGDFQGHKYAQRLLPEEKELVRELTENMALPRNIMTTQKKRRPQTATTMKHIYNIRCRMNMAIRGSRTKMQHLMKCMTEGKYLYNHRVIPGTETMSDIFWAHLDSVKIFNTFPTVVMMDSTYKTNKYRLPLFEIVGSTSTGRTYPVGFAFLSQEKEDKFVWALQSIRGMLLCQDDMKVIVTDRDQALINAVNIVFPKCTPLICRYHIQMNIKANFIKKAKLGRKLRIRTVWRHVKIL